MAKLVTAITKSVGPVGNITLILGVIIYIFAVVGIKVFGDVYTTDKFGIDGVPRWNFDDFWHAFMMMFRVLCGEWIEPLWDCMRATNPMAILFFLPAFVIGNFIVSITKSLKVLFQERSFISLPSCFQDWAGLITSNKEQNLAHPKHFQAQRYGQ